MREELSGILEHVERIQALDLDAVPPTTHVRRAAERGARGRAARVLASEEALREAPEVVEGSFAVVKFEQAVSALHELTAEQGVAALHAGEVERRGPGRRRPGAGRGRPLGRVPGGRRRGRPRPRAEIDALRRAPAARAGCRSRSRTPSPPRDSPTTAGSRILEGFRPVYTATVRRAARAGRRGRHRQDQHGRVRHGLDAPRTPPTSSPATPGTRARAGRLDAAARRRRWPPARRPGRSARDTGGSIRQPAALCGIVGHEADLRRGLALRADRLRVVARPGRAVRAHGRATPPCSSPTSPATTRWTRRRSTGPSRSRLPEATGLEGAAGRRGRRADGGRRRAGRARRGRRGPGADRGARRLGRARQPRRPPSTASRPTT